jgi:hypothetical protein
VPFSRWQGVDEEHPTGFGYVSPPRNGKYSSCSLVRAVVLHQEIYESNKMKRLLFPVPIPFSLRHKVFRR